MVCVLGFFFVCLGILFFVWVFGDAYSNQRPVLLNQKKTGV